VQGAGGPINSLVLILVVFKGFYTLVNVCIAIRLKIKEEQRKNIKIYSLKTMP